MSSAAIRSMICWLSCVGSSIAGFLPTLDVARSARPPEGAARGLANLDRVLEATRKGPTAQLPAPDCSTTSRIKGQRRQRAAGPPFSARNGPPARAIGDCSPNLPTLSDPPTGSHRCWGAPSRLVVSDHPKPSQEPVNAHMGDERGSAGAVCTRLDEVRDRPASGSQPANGAGVPAGLSLIHI